MSDRSVVSTPSAPAAIGPYSQAVVVPPLVFTAGQIAIVPATGALAGDDIRTQTRQALENVSAILRAAGTSLDRVVKTTVFVKDMGEFQAMNEVYAEFFPSSPPARSTVEVARLPRDVRVEIEAIAVVNR
ncbi:MAG: endoribonuclease [Bacteroidetes bacterium]|nr:endoribonuclease [Bacteroidota bacterium]